ncbi:MAG: TIGR03936 family radical SAM-associated protein [Armatimonadetes bacterium]|nr:TIGR03936 family radical SAM-associated protein [Armatimonadota bacterium]
MMLRERTFALITFRKVGRLRFLGHLDVVRAFDRAIRRAKLPVAYSQGFSPHTLLSFAMPLPVGIAGENELAGLELSVEWDPRAVYKSLSLQLPPELGIVGVQMMQKSKRSVFADLAGADYRADLVGAEEAALQQAVRGLQDEREWLIHRTTKSKNLDLDLKPRVYGLLAREHSLLMRISLGQDTLAKPEEVVELISRHLDAPVQASLTRLALYTERQLPFTPALQ